MVFPCFFNKLFINPDKGGYVGETVVEERRPCQVCNVTMISAVYLSKVWLTYTAVCKPRSPINRSNKTPFTGTNKDTLVGHDIYSSLFARGKRKLQRHKLQSFGNFLWLPVYVLTQSLFLVSYKEKGPFV